MTDTTEEMACVDTARLSEVLARHPKGDRTALIHALQDLQETFHHLPVAGVAAVCDHLKVPLAKAFSVATFYRAFSLSPRGEVVIRVCTGTTCHIRGAAVLVDDLVKELGIHPGETTSDLKFTVETVNCVGACAMAPVVCVNGVYHGQVQPGEIAKAIR